MQNERLLRENRRLAEQCRTLKNRCICLEDNQQTQKKIIDRLKSDNDLLKQQIKNLKNKLEQVRFEQDQRQNNFQFIIKSIEQQLDQKTTEYEKLENKIMPLFDTDTVRLKILNQIEYPHQLEMQEKEGVIEDLKEQIFDFKRQIEYLKCKLETQRLEQDREIRQLKSQQKTEMNRLLLDLQSYQNLEYSNRSNNKIQAFLKKDLEYYKEKYSKADQEVHRLRQQIEIVKADYHRRATQLIEQTAELRQQMNRIKANI